MKYYLRGIGILAIMISIMEAQPKLSVDKLDFDFGSVFAGKKKDGHVKLQNIGNDTLRIISIDPSCGCTTVKKPAEFLAPGKSDIVQIEFNSSGYHAGKTEKYLHIATNDPSSPNVTVKFHVLIKEDLETIDHNFWLGEVSVNQSLVKNISVKNVSGKTLTIKKIICSTPSLQAHVSSMIIRDSAVFDVQVTFTAAKSGYGIEYVWLETDSQNQPRVELRVPYMAKDSQ